MNREKLKQILDSLTLDQLKILPEYQGIVKHYEVAKHWANGGEVETWCEGAFSGWSRIDHDTFRFNPDLKYRIVEQTHKVNGFDVPAPVSHEGIDSDRIYYASDPTNDEFYFECFLVHEGNLTWIDRGLVFATKEAAIASARAMCRINPYSDE